MCSDIGAKWCWEHRGVSSLVCLWGGESQNAQEKVNLCRPLIARQRAKFILGPREPILKCKGLEARGKKVCNWGGGNGMHIGGLEGKMCMWW